MGVLAYLTNLVSGHSKLASVPAGGAVAVSAGAATTAAEAPAGNFTSCTVLYRGNHIF